MANRKYLPAVIIGIIAVVATLALINGFVATHDVHNQSVAPNAIDVSQQKVTEWYFTGSFFANLTMDIETQTPQGDRPATVSGYSIFAADGLGGSGMLRWAVFGIVVAAGAASTRGGKSLTTSVGSALGVALVYIPVLLALGWLSGTTASGVVGSARFGPDIGALVTGGVFVTCALAGLGGALVWVARVARRGSINFS